jgi:hypothetical protein
MVYRGSINWYNTDMREIHNYIASRVTESDQLYGGTPCLEWTLKLHKDRGYGVAKIKGQSKWAHRVSYELHNGPLRPGYTIDHLCFNTACVNPEHLEQVTQEENFARYMVKYLEENPFFNCGHPRRAESSKLRVRTLKNGRVKRQYRCSICEKAYMKEYMKTYRKPAK